MKRCWMLVRILRLHWGIEASFKIVFSSPRYVYRGRHLGHWEHRRCCYACQVRGYWPSIWWSCTHEDSTGNALAIDLAVCLFCGAVFVCPYNKFLSKAWISQKHCIVHENAPWLCTCFVRTTLKQVQCPIKGFRPVVFCYLSENLLCSPFLTMFLLSNQCFYYQKLSNAPYQSFYAYS